MHQGTGRVPRGLFQALGFLMGLCGIMRGDETHKIVSYFSWLFLGLGLV